MLFSNIRDKHRFSSIQFAFYSSCSTISPIILNTALIFARNFVSISKSDIQLILTAKEILIGYDNHNWHRADSVNLSP